MGSKRKLKDGKGKTREETYTVDGPMVFQCVECYRIVGHSRSFLCGDEGNQFITLRAAVGTRVHPQLVTSSEAFDIDSNYRRLECAHCGTVVGRTYATTNPNLDHMRGAFTLHAPAISTFVLEDDAPPPPSPQPPVDAVVKMEPADAEPAAAADAQACETCVWHHIEMVKATCLLLEEKFDDGLRALEAALGARVAAIEAHLSSAPPPPGAGVKHSLKTPIARTVGSPASLLRQQAVSPPPSTSTSGQAATMAQVLTEVAAAEAAAVAAAAARGGRGSGGAAGVEVRAQQQGGAHMSARRDGRSAGGSAAASSSGGSSYSGSDSSSSGRDGGGGARDVHGGAKGPSGGSRGIADIAAAADTLPPAKKAKAKK